MKSESSSALGDENAVSLGETSLKLLSDMKKNPRDWRIADVERLCGLVGLKISPPSSGSHYKVRSAHIAGILTVPAKRPIKAPYIRLLTSLADAHFRAEANKGGT